MRITEYREDLIRSTSFLCGTSKLASKELERSAHSIVIGWVGTRRYQDLFLNLEIKVEDLKGTNVNSGFGKRL